MAEVDGRFDVADTKTRSLRRTLSVPASLIDELAEHLATHRHGTRPDDLVFSAAEGGPLRRSFEGRIFKQDIKDTGLDPALTFHGLRHVAASLMEASDVAGDASFGMVGDRCAVRVLGFSLLGAVG
jgi:integrase